MTIGLLTVHLQVPGCLSLKEKRSRLKPLLTRIHREFNVSVAELDKQDAWQEAVIGAALVSNESSQAQRSLQVVANWIEDRWPDVTILEQHIEII